MDDQTPPDTDPRVRILSVDKAIAEIQTLRLGMVKAGELIIEARGHRSDALRAHQASATATADGDEGKAQALAGRACLSERAAQQSAVDALALFGDCLRAAFGADDPFLSGHGGGMTADQALALCHVMAGHK